MRGLNTKIAYQIIWEKLLSKAICTKFVGSNKQLVDELTKSLREPWIELICSKHGAYNLYAPT